jgi:hypothetical protein
VKQTPLKRKTELRVDPDKARDWLRRSRKPLGKGKRKRRLVVPPETTMTVRARSDGKCVVCIHQGRPRPKKAQHRHHVFPVSTYPLLELVADGQIGICADHHWAHEYSPNFKIPLMALPECVFRLAADVGPAAVDYLLDRYER